MDSIQLQNNLTKVYQSIDAIYPLASNYHLIAVTKTVSDKVIRALYQMGVSHFGENRPQILAEKAVELQDLKEIQWHFIGRLQTRQVKTILPYVSYIHSLDRLSLAQEIQKRATQQVKCFVQVNVSGEATKTGLSVDETMSFIEQLQEFSMIQVVGLMTMAPFNYSQEELHRDFKKLKQLQETVVAQNWQHAPCRELSMGMSQDYLIALEEGATFIRVGTAITQGVE